MFQKMISRFGLSLVLAATLFAGVVFPVFAASPAPTIAVGSVYPGSEVQLTFSYLPAGVEFAVSMGPVGSQGKGSVVAHISSSDGDVVTGWYEILSSVTGDQKIEVRIDNGAGLSAYTTFSNVSTSTTSTSTSSAATTTSSVATSAVRSMQALHAEAGGWVNVLIRNLPADSVFTVTIGEAGTQGVGGSVVGTLSTNTEQSGMDAVSTFEIPTLFSSNSKLDLRLDNGSVVYVLTFKNADY